MIVSYDVYRRYADRDREDRRIAMENDQYYGKRYQLVENYSSFSITLNRQKIGKFSIKGSATGTAPFVVGDGIIFYRNAELLFTGIVEDVEIKCKDVPTGIIEWEASGEDESVIFDSRVILTDFRMSQNETAKDVTMPDGKTKTVYKSFENLTFYDEIFDKCNGYAYDRMIHYIRNCFDKNITLPGREINNMKFPNASSVDKIPVADRGTNELSSYRLKKLSTVLNEIGKENNLFPQYVWNPITGEKRITIPIQRDLSGMDSSKTYDDNKLIVISPEYGNVSKWTVKHTLPKFNAVWVCSGEYNTVDEEDTENEALAPYYRHAPDGTLLEAHQGIYDFTIENGRITGYEINLQRAMDASEIERVKAEKAAARKAKYDARAKEKCFKVQKTQGFNYTREEFDQIVANKGIDWVCDQLGVTIEDEKYATIVWVYAEDEASIAKYGRIEQIITKSDIKITDDDPETEDVETVTEEEVIELLKQEARKQLQDNAEKEKYTITIAQNDDFAFMDNWKCGDKVKVVIDGKEFSSSIETVAITFTGNKETVTPTVGAVEEGVFSEVFRMISGMETRITNEEEG